MASEWRDVPLRLLLAEPVRNGVYKPSEYHGRGVKMVNMGELFAHPRLRSVHMSRVELSPSEIERFGLAGGDLLFARRSLVAEGAGKCSVVLEVEELTAFESSIIRARPDIAKADAQFLYYFFNSPLGLHRLDTIRRQVAVAGITGSDLAELDIPVPPVSEQRAIAHILGTLDDKIELNRRMNETLEAMARALFKSWFIDFDPVCAKAGAATPTCRSILPTYSLTRSRIRSLGRFRTTGAWRGLATCLSSAWTAVRLQPRPLHAPMCPLSAYPHGHCFYRKVGPAKKRRAV